MSAGDIIEVKTSTRLRQPGHTLYYRVDKSDGTRLFGTPTFDIQRHAAVHQRQRLVRDYTLFAAIAAVRIRRIERLQQRHPLVGRQPEVQAAAVV